MDLQNNQIIHQNPLEMPTVYHPINSESNNQDTPTQIYQNSQSNQLYQAIQFQSQNNNNPLIPGDHNYLITKEPLINLFEDNKLEIPFNKRISNISFFIFLFIIDLLSIIFLPSFHKIYISIAFIFESILYLYFEKLKIVIIKDESQTKINIKIINYLCKTKQKFDYDLNSVNFKVILSKNKYRLLILNNPINGKIIDLNFNDIGNTPLKLLFSFDNINVKKFKSQTYLNKILDDFTKSSSTKDSPLNFDINSYMKKQVCNYNPNGFNKYIKINNNFFTYFNIIPFKTKILPYAYKIISFLIHSLLLYASLFIYKDEKEEKEEKEEVKDDDYYHEDINYPSQFFLLIITSYSILFLCTFCICRCIDLCKTKCLRIDIIFSLDFDRMFIGASYNGDIKYIKTFDLKLDIIERFFLEKNNKGFNLNEMSKGNITKQLLYIKDRETELEGLIYILNEKIVNNNNGHQQQCTSEYTRTILIPS